MSDPSRIEFISITSKLKFCQKAQVDGLDGRLNTSFIRSIYWRLYLGILVSDDTVENWKENMRVKRARYEELLIKFIPNLETDENINVNNPLMLNNDNNIWNVFHKNNELIDTIKLDLLRTYNDNDMIQSDNVQLSLLHVLFVWCKLHPNISYRQGMNEIIAPIYMLLNKEYINVSNDENDLFSYLTDLSNIEADCFIIFETIMNRMSPYYEHSNKDNSQQSKIVLKCNDIHHKLLAAKDPILYNHLENSDVIPQLYALRWIRLLFTREFQHIESVYIIWDAIFAFSEDFKLMDGMCVAMLQFVRNNLLEGDNTTILRRLLRYPPVEDINVLVIKARSFFLPVSISALSPISPTSPETVRSNLASPSRIVISPTSGRIVFAPTIRKESSTPVRKDNVVTSLINKAFDLLIEPENKVDEVATLAETPTPTVDPKIPQLVSKLESIISVFQTQFNDKPDLNICLQNLAQLKQIKDVLAGRLEMEDLNTIFNILPADLEVVDESIKSTNTFSSLPPTLTLSSQIQSASPVFVSAIRASPIADSKVDDLFKSIIGSDDDKQLFGSGAKKKLGITKLAVFDDPFGE